MARTLATAIATLGVVIGLIALVYQGSQVAAERVSHQPGNDAALHGAFELITERGGVGYIGG